MAIIMSHVIHQHTSGKTGTPPWTALCLLEMAAISVAPDHG